ncbi:speckle targeted PIP5K1A-regulated poly(A) polymerase-like [Nymphalis io]|uniref:speckle targeted PIP5K1A-regulated poly(A) polymerase-like n=1 Tax=Inachis io TaxID=171585 RepID=UPI002167432B|nr:speckle targeted PIP5K1A-regulated poly(A) polymerase-like [Nymphalis io]XP_050344108.1 speckle targeted PIP5K1A-regulated poly(A) polymerase-like [Nymphalis io]XP_050344109.1 speckle targeted PIP5K1A-regulated poly(A) polymerase-like [Nymphalis io]XP_050344110.1 speckle targeted PIP5K1A-regulated poly(A) polymerase-like [Nymphalis io]
METLPQPADSRKVLVTGYPSYTQPQDLTRIFSSYGTVKVVKINNKCAVLEFKDEDEAKDAIQDSNEVNIYGEFLTVKQFTQKSAPTTPKRDFGKSKKKASKIIEPLALDLSGDFHQQLAGLLGAVRLAQDEVAALAELYHDLEQALQQPWPGCVATPFGSITTGLGIKTSDADCYINVPPNLRHANANYVLKAKRVLHQYPHLFAEILAIPRANTPIVKFFHIPTETNCDVTFKTPLGSQNSKLIAFLLHADPRLVPVAVLVKYWARVHGLSGTGRLTNYALTMLLLFYLQQPPVSLLPSVSWLQRDADYDCIVDHWNTGFMHHHDRLPESTNTSSISELLGGFFQYYSTFNFNEMVVCPFLGSPIKKDLFKDLSLLPQELGRYVSNIRERLTSPMRFTTSMCIQDPFDLCHNVASPITSRLAFEIKEFFRFAAAAYDKEKLNNCKGLLQMILIQKPKISNGKLHPEFRVVIYPYVIQSIINPDWKSVVTDVMKKVFEHVCKIKLVKIEEKANNTGKKQKDKYLAVVDKPIWKRNQFSKLYNLMHLEFLQKQTRITEEILNVEKQQYNVQFRLTLTFSQEPKTAAACIKLIEGDPAVFREFGKFFISSMHNWFMTLIKTELKPREKKPDPTGSDVTNSEATNPESEVVNSVKSKNVEHQVVNNVQHQNPEADTINSLAEKEVLTTNVSPTDERETSSTEDTNKDTDNVECIAP